MDDTLFYRLLWIVCVYIYSVCIYRLHNILMLRINMHQELRNFVYKISENEISNVNVEYFPKCTFLSFHGQPIYIGDKMWCMPFESWPFHKPSVLTKTLELVVNYTYKGRRFCSKWIRYEIKEQNYYAKGTWINNIFL